MGLRGERVRQNGTVATAGTATKEVSTTGGACVGQNGWDMDFAQRAYKCGLRSMANAYRSGVCMAKKQHVSVECGACIGELIHCGLHCAHECCLGKCFTNENCLVCQTTFCHEGFVTCAGVPPPR